MQRFFGARTLLAICAGAAVLLAALAAVQYRWSARVAAADAQREREHLQSSAELFATDFDQIATKTVAFLQNDVANAVKSGEKLTGVPRVISELYYLDFSATPVAGKKTGKSGRRVVTTRHDELAITVEQQTRSEHAQNAARSDAGADAAPSGANAPSQHPGNASDGGKQGTAPGVASPHTIRVAVDSLADSATPPRVMRLSAEGTFVPAEAPAWLTLRRCGSMPLTHPMALVAPLYEVTSLDAQGTPAVGILRTFTQRPGRCFVARLDENYLRNELFPQAIARAFGETSAREYDFAVLTRTQPPEVLYGRPLQADLKKPFGTVSPVHLTPPLHPQPARTGQNAIFIERFESTIVGAPPSAARELFDQGVWELQVAHKGVPLAVAFEQTRRRNLLLSLGVEALLIAAMVFLVVAVRRMQQLAEQKMQFVAAVSHELRSPLSAISMLSQNQADGLVSGPDKVRNYGELMHNQARRLNDMVEQTLQYAGIHSGLRRPLRNPVDLRALITEAVEARREQLRACGFQVEIAVSSDVPVVPGDASLLRTAFDNLLSNAEKHAGGGRWLRVSASYAAAQKEVRISVEDRGPGIDASEQEQIFEPFCRGQAATEAQTPGSGLGLSLVRSAAEAHHGTVTLESEPGRGSTFTLHLPV